MTDTYNHMRGHRAFLDVKPYAHPPVRSNIRVTRAAIANAQKQAKRGEGSC